VECVREMAVNEQISDHLKNILHPIGSLSSVLVITQISFNHKFVFNLILVIEKICTYIKCLYDLLRHSTLFPL